MRAKRAGGSRDNEEIVRRGGRRLVAGGGCCRAASLCRRFLRREQGTAGGQARLPDQDSRPVAGPDDHRHGVHHPLPVDRHARRADRGFRRRRRSDRPGATRRQADRRLRSRHHGDSAPLCSLAAPEPAGQDAGHRPHDRRRLRGGRYRLSGSRHEGAAPVSGRPQRGAGGPRLGPCGPPDARGRGGRSLCVVGLFAGRPCGPVGRAARRQLPAGSEAGRACRRGARGRACQALHRRRKPAFGRGYSARWWSNPGRSPKSTVRRSANW